jgi:hypothetical protein
MRRAMTRVGSQSHRKKIHEIELFWLYEYIHFIMAYTCPRFQINLLACFVYFPPATFFLLVSLLKFVNVQTRF